MHGYDNPKPELCQATKECKEAYIVMHNFILSHATTVKLYREKFQVGILSLSQNICGLILNNDHSKNIFTIV